MTDASSDFEADLEPSSPVEYTLGRRLLFVWFAVWAVLVTIPSSIFQLTSHQFRPTAANFKRWASFWGRTILAGIGVRVRVEDAALLDRASPHIFVSNHQNALDILALSAALPYPFGFIAKAELERVPFLGFAIRNSASVLIDRSEPRRSVESLKQAGQRIRNGNSVLVFAEGSRSYSPVLAPFKKGAFVLAVEAGVPLVPVALVDGYKLMDERRRLAKPGTMRIRIGPPISLENSTRRDIPELMEKTRSAIANLISDDAPSNVTSPGSSSHHREVDRIH